MDFPRRVKVRNPIVDLDGDEMTRVIWKEVKDRLIRPFFDVEIDYYDLGLPNRNITEDKVTHESVEAVQRHLVAVKCPTISVDKQRVDEYKLKEAWPSPNGTLRQAIGGTLFRAPIIIPGLPRPVPAWTKPIILARHAFGDQMAGKDRLFKEAGTFSMIFRPKNGGPPTEVKVSDLPDSGGVVTAHSNTTESITGFAQSTFKFALQKSMPVYLATKSSILTHYDGHFQEIFEQIYDREFRSEFEDKGLFYEHRINDELLAHLYKLDGNVIIAMKNYDGDAQSDALAQAFGSQALVTSALVPPDGKVFVSEVAHGTVTKHYYAHLRGESTSTNPIACIFAWTQALIRRGELDGTADVVSVAKAIEQATIDTVAVDNILTKDLAFLFKDERRLSAASTSTFLENVQTRMLSTPCL